MSEPNTSRNVLIVGITINTAVCLSLRGQTEQTVSLVMGVV